MSKLAAIGKSVIGTVLLGIGLTMLTSGVGMMDGSKYGLSFGTVSTSSLGFVLVIISFFFIPVGVRIIAKA